MTKEIKNSIRESLKKAVFEAGKKLSIDTFPEIFLDRPSKGHGQFSSNIAFLIAKKNKKSPLETAGLISQHFKNPFVEETKPAPPGFINFFLKRSSFYPVLLEIEEKSAHFGENNLGGQRKALIEFVSANPTGPLHIGHGRNAVTGDVLANILKASGFDVEKEYYVNDAGLQMETLGKSLRDRYLEELGISVEGKIGYAGEYLSDIAKELVSSGGDSHKDSAVEFFTNFASQRLLVKIREDLETFGVRFDHWIFESQFHKTRAVEEAMSLLEKAGYIKEKDGAKWFVSSRFGDEKDRVIIRSSGEPTYLASDAAYHYQKIKRGYELLINVWGSDHHGYIKRVRSSIEAFGYPGESLKIILIQLVKLSRGGKPIPMSTREGKFVCLSEVLDEVGPDAARFTFLTRRSDAQLDFDLELVKSQSRENPVYYVQYAYARISNVFLAAGQKGLSVKRAGRVNLELLKEKEEFDLIECLSVFPEIVEGAARTFEPHRLTVYLQKLAGLFHNFYDHYRIVVAESTELAYARLFLITSIQTVLRNGLGLLGISAPDRM